MQWQEVAPLSSKMDELKIYIFKYINGKEKVNEFYAASADRNNLENVIKKINNIKWTWKVFRENWPLGIAGYIETNILEKHDFVKINGIKQILPSYKEIIANAIFVKIDKKGKTSALSNKEHYLRY